MLFVPYNLNIDHDFPAIRNFSTIGTYIPVIIFCFIILSAIYNLKKFPVQSFGVLFFFLAISVESSVIPLGNVIMEHRLYLPVWGFTLFITCTVFSIRYINDSQRYAVFILIICLFSYLTYQRNAVWKNDITLWSDAVKKSPNKLRPHQNLCVGYYAEQKYSEAIAECKAALQIDSSDMVSYNNLILMLNILGQTQEAEIYLKKMKDVDTENILYRQNQADFYFVQEKYNDALEVFKELLKKDNTYGEKVLKAAILLENKKEYDYALAYYDLIKTSNTDNYKVYLNSGKINYYKNNYKSALIDLDSALKFNIDDYEIMYFLAMTYINIGDRENAKKYFEMAVGKNPNNPQLYIEYAKFLKQDGNDSRADEILEKANKLLFKGGTGLGLR
jgi:tetratricopeptide (TPR) repeat protein